MGASDSVLTLDQAVREALARNSGLFAMTRVAEAARERPVQAAALPNPMLTYRGMDVPDAAKFPVAGERRFEFEQTLPGFGKREMRQAVALNEASLAVQEVAVAASDLVLTVRETCFELQSVQESLQLTSEEERLLNRMKEAAAAKYAAGEGAQSDMIKIQAERVMLRQRILDWEGREARLKARLSRLLSRDSSNGIDRVSALVPPEVFGAMVATQAVGRALMQRPEMQAARLKAERGGLQRRLTGHEVQPDYKVGLEYRSLESSENMVMFMVGVELPLWRRKNQAMLNEAARMADAGEAALEDVRRQVTLEVQEACSRLETARRLLELTHRDLVPAAGLRLESSESGYRSGREDLSNWLESARFLLSAKAQVVLAGAELGAAWAALDRAVGGVP